MILFNFVRQSDATVIVYIVITDLDDTIRYSRYSTPVMKCFNV